MMLFFAEHMTYKQTYVRREQTNLDIKIEM